MRSTQSSLFLAAAVLATGAALPLPSSTEMLPLAPARTGGLGDWVERNNRRRQTKGSFGGSSGYSKKRHGNPAGSKLARKAARGKL